MKRFENRIVIEASFSTGSEFIAGGGQLLGPVPQLTKETKNEAHEQA